MRNRYPGNCCICAKHVPSGNGYFELAGKTNNKKFLVRCEDCVGKGAPWKQKCQGCGKKLLPGEGHYEEIKEDEGGGWYASRWIAHCDKCQKEVSDE